MRLAFPFELPRRQIPCYLDYYRGSRIISRLGRILQTEEPLPGAAVACREALSFVGGKAGMVEVVQDVQGGLAGAAAAEEVFELSVRAACRREHRCGAPSRRKESSRDPA